MTTPQSNNQTRRVSWHIVITFVLLQTVLGPHALACTRVFMNTGKHRIVARNEDYLTPVDPTMVLTPRGITRVGSKEKNAAKWKTKYGNVCMYANNQFPMDGLNEKGLTARTLFFTQRQQVDVLHPDRPALDSPYWISYILDNFATELRGNASPSGDRGHGPIPCPHSRTRAPTPTAA